MGASAGLFRLKPPPPPSHLPSRTVSLPLLSSSSLPLPLSPLCSPTHTRLLSAVRHTRSHTRIRTLPGPFWSGRIRSSCPSDTSHVFSHPFPLPLSPISHSPPSGSISHNQHPLRRRSPVPPSLLSPPPCRSLGTTACIPQRPPQPPSDPRRRSQVHNNNSSISPPIPSPNNNNSHNNKLPRSTTSLNSSSTTSLAVP